MKRRTVFTLYSPPFSKVCEGVGFGTRSAASVRHRRGRRHYIIKGWEHGIGELRSEECASAIGKIFNFPVQEARLCRVPSKELRESLMLSTIDERYIFVKIDVRRQRDKSNKQNNIEEMIHGADIISAYDSTYFTNNARVRNQKYTIDLIENALNHFQKNHKEAKTIKYEFFIMCVFDALIGGTERHDYNWGILLSSPEKQYLRLTKFFDNGISLLWNFEEKKTKYKKILVFSRGPELDQFLRKGESKIRKNCSSSNCKLSLFDVCAILKERNFINKNELKTLLKQLIYIKNHPTKLKNAIVHSSPQSTDFEARFDVYSWIYKLVQYRLDILITILAKNTL